MCMFALLARLLQTEIGRQGRDFRRCARGSKQLAGQSSYELLVSTDISYELLGQYGLQAIVGSTTVFRRCARYNLPAAQVNYDGERESTTFSEQGRTLQTEKCFLPSFLLAS